MKAVILCAGFGTRLGEFTKDCPKPLLKVGNISILERQILSLKNVGVKDVFINLHYLADKIIESIGDGSKYGVNISYLHENSPSGTAGGIKIFEKFLKDERDFFVLYGDIVTDEDFGRLSRFHKDKKADLSFYIHQREDSNSIVEFDEEGVVRNFLERPSFEEKEALKKVSEINKFYVNSAIYILNAKVLALIPANSVVDLPRDIFPKLLVRKKLYALPIKGRRVAVDSIERLAKANELFKESL
jgi:mannose-1-phosphate guanylyltransferase